MGQARRIRIVALGPCPQRLLLGEDAIEARPNPEPAPQTRTDDLCRTDRSEILIPSGSQGEFPNEPVRDWLARRECDASLGRLEAGRGNVAGMRLDGGRR